MPVLVLGITPSCVPKKKKDYFYFRSLFVFPIYKSEGEDKGDFYELRDGFHASMGSFLSINAKSNYKLPTLLMSEKFLFRWSKNTKSRKHKLIDDRRRNYNEKLTMMINLRIFFVEMIDHLLTPFSRKID